MSGVVSVHACATAIAILLALSAAYGAAQESGERRQDGQAQQVFGAVCGKCHPVERVTAMRRSRSQWEETIESMITARGAQISDEEFDTVLIYLIKEYGRVDINRAPADEIGEVLAIPAEMAEEIVAYRKQHGLFEDFDALMKVPGIDRPALEKKRDAISF